MPFSYFDDLETHIDDVLSELDKSIPKANSELMDAFMELYYKLDKASTGTIEASVKNLNTINAFKSQINGILENGAYGEGITSYLNSYTSSSHYINDYFGSIVNNFKSNTKLYDAILQANVNTTTNSLLNSGIDANFTDPITKVLQDMVTGGSNKKEFMETLAANLNDETGLLNRYIPQVAQDSIMQFNANYTQTVSNDLGLAHYYYKGTKKSTSRQFCINIIGKYFTEENLHKYFNKQNALNSGKGWDGEIKGTNWGNFFINRGGWNCRHMILPISKEVYDSRPDSSKYIA